MPLPISDEEKVRVLHQIFQIYSEHGFEGISMDEVAKRIGLSKATLYKYFKSKEDIVRDMVDQIIAYLNTTRFKAENGIADVLDSIALAYYKAVLTAAYSGSTFLADLKVRFADIYADYIETLASVQERFAAFYGAAVREGYCKDVSIGLFGEQMKRMLPVIIGDDYLREHSTTLVDVLTEYYRLILHQLLSVDYIDAAVQEENYSFIIGLIEVLESDYLTE